LIAGIFLTLNGPSIIVRGLDALQYDPAIATDPFAGFMGNDKSNEIYFNTLKHGSYIDILKANFYEHTTKMKFPVLSGRLYITAGLFLMGFYVGKKKYLVSFGRRSPF
jgi:hypothetical protein